MAFKFLKKYGLILNNFMVFKINMMMKINNYVIFIAFK